MGKLSNAQRFGDLSKGMKALVILSAGFWSLFGLALVGGSSSQPKTTTPTPQVQSAVLTYKPKVEKKTVEVRSTIPHGQKAVDDPSLAKGTTKVTQQGVDGEKVITYDIVYTDGKESSRNPLSEVVTVAAVDEIVANGTYVYVAPTYTPAPTTQSSTGARTGAVCSDGTSSSATGRGACSHHGGVAYWTY